MDAEFRGQGVELVQHWLDLLLVIGRLDDIAGDHQQAIRRHCGLGIVALIKAAAGDRHDARCVIGQIDLVGGPRTRSRGFGRLAPRFLAGLLGPRLARRQLGLIRRLLCAKRSLARASIFARAAASLVKRSARRANSSGIDRPSGSSARSAASALAISSLTSAFSCASILPACS